MKLPTNIKKRKVASWNPLLSGAMLPSSGAVGRSQDLKGFSLVGLCDVRDSRPLFSCFRCNSFIENASALKKPQAKLKKMHNLGHKNNNTPKEPQPKRVEEVYRALKNGLE